MKKNGINTVDKLKLKKSEPVSYDMKIGDFVDLISRYGSYFVEDKDDNNKNIITNFVNYIAAQNGMDYGMYMDELEKHKKKDIVPVDVDVLIRQSKMLQDCYDALVSIYGNTDDAHVEATIENLADKHQNDLSNRIKIYRNKIYRK